MTKISLSPHFIQEHMNYYCSGSSIGNLIMSLKHEEAEGQEFLRIMLRYSEVVLYFMHLGLTW